MTNVTFQNGHCMCSHIKSNFRDIVLTRYTLYVKTYVSESNNTIKNISAAFVNYLLTMSNYK